MGNVRLEVLIDNTWQPVQNLAAGWAVHGNSPSFAPVPESSRDALWQFAAQALEKTTGKPLTVVTADAGWFLFAPGAAGPFRISAADTA